MFRVVDCRGHVCHAGHENVSIMFTTVSEAAI